MKVGYLHDKSKIIQTDKRRFSFIPQKIKQFEVNIEATTQVIFNNFLNMDVKYFSDKIIMSLF